MSSGYDEIYFSEGAWKERVEAWLKRRSSGGLINPFLNGNVRLVRQVLEDQDTGLRMVINIGAEALLSFLQSNEYKNIYDEPIIGGRAREPSSERREVDRLLGFENEAKNFFFGAATLGGTGVRFYGEYCMVIKRDRVEDTTRLFDRDSYDLLLPPLSDYPDREDLVAMLRGTWTADVVHMLTLKMLPELREPQRLITVGTISELVIRDQEFVEVHLKNRIYLDNLEEIRQSPDEASLEAGILRRKELGIQPTAVELRWLQQRELVFVALRNKGIRYRVVTLHGRGYQWR
jgi:hypothetical protein